MTLTNDAYLDWPCDGCGAEPGEECREGCGPQVWAEKQVGLKAEVA